MLLAASLTRLGLIWLAVGKLELALLATRSTQAHQVLCNNSQQTGELPLLLRTNF
jgi:hypothetical protein